MLRHTKFVILISGSLELKFTHYIEGSKVKGANFNFGQKWHFVFFETYKTPFICCQNFKFNFIPYMGKIEESVLGQLPLETNLTGKRFQVHLVPLWQQRLNLLQWKKVPSSLGTFYPWNYAVSIQQHSCYN